MTSTPPVRSPRRYRRLVIAGAAGLAVVGFAACGSSGSSSGSATAASTPASAPATSTAADAPKSGATELTLSADAGMLMFDKTRLAAKAGTVVITMKNPAGSGPPHAIAIEGHGVDVDGKTAPPGGTSTVTATLKPGKYTFYCPVPGHEQAGMKGTLTVS